MKKAGKNEAHNDQDRNRQAATGKNGQSQRTQRTPNAFTKSGYPNNKSGQSKRLPVKRSKLEGDRPGGIIPTTI